MKKNKAEEITGILGCDSFVLAALFPNKPYPDDIRFVAFDGEKQALMPVEEIYRVWLALARVLAQPEYSSLPDWQQKICSKAVTTHEMTKKFREFLATRALSEDEEKA